MLTRCTLLLLGCLAGLLLSGPPARAQQPASTTDVLLLTTGQELSGRVLAITPTELTYLAAPASPGADTLRLPTAQVFLVRYANGTREVIERLLAPTPAPTVPDLTPPALRELTTAQRLALGQHDALRYYRASGPFWGSLGATLYAGPLLGLIPAIATSSTPARSYNLHAPQPQLLADPHYAQGYQQQATKIKSRRAWGGYLAGTAAYVVLIAALLTTSH